MRETAAPFNRVPARRVFGGKFPFVAALLAVVLLSGACSDAIDSASGGGPNSFGGQFPKLIGTDSAEATTGHSCSDLSAHVRDSFVLATAPRSSGAGEDFAVQSSDVMEGVAPMEAAASLGRSDSDSQVIAGTNIQELGVDEADIIKTDGERIVAVNRGALRVVTLDGDPEVDGVLEFSDSFYSPEMYLLGDEALIVSGQGGPWVQPMEIMEDGVIDRDSSSPIPDPPMPFEQGVTISRVDLSDPTNPTEIERRVVEGTLVESREVDGVVRLVVSSYPRYEELGRDSAGVLPQATNASGVARTLLECNDIEVLPMSLDPDYTSYATPSTTTVYTVDETLADLAPTSILGNGATLYSSNTALYLAGGSWNEQGETTAIHRFAINGSDAAEYTGTATVPGYLNDRYAMSERNGDLRVVTTKTDLNAIDPEDSIVALDEMVFVSPTEAQLTVLRPNAAGELAEISHVEDMGQGEEVQSVRYVDDMAYVVTFRRTDPLYAIDLSDPTNPRALGELKVTGFSQYMHPVADGLILGIGREATTEGMDIGFKASLFDVSNPEAPVEVDKLTLDERGYTEALVANDPHAFTWDPVGSQAIVATMGDQGDALVIGVDGNTLVDTARITGQPGLSRSVVVDRNLWTLSEMGLGVTDADNIGTSTIIDF